MSVKVAIAQINCTVGDLSANAEKILAACEKAAALRRAGRNFAPVHGRRHAGGGNLTYRL
jgi:hypothetical protein